MNWVSKVDIFLYINLEDRPERDAEMKQVLREQFALPSGKIHRINAIRDFPGSIGCTKSHLKALQFAIEAKARYACLLEDDFMLTVDPKTFHKKVNQGWEELKGEFDVMFLTMTPIQLEAQNTPGFHRVLQALAMPALVVHHRYFTKLKAIYETALRKKDPHDMVTQQYQRYDHWYGFYPALARQRPGFSDIEGRNVDYGYLDVDAVMLKDKPTLPPPTPTYTGPCQVSNPWMGKIIVQ